MDEDTTTKKPGKKELKAATLKRDAEIFREACINLDIIPAKDAKYYFGATRQTVTSWMQGKTSPPRDAFIKIVQLYNAEKSKSLEAMQRRMDEQEERLAAALKAADEIKRELNMKGGIK